MSVELTERTRRIKKLLELEYGKGMVRVTAHHRGTAYGWITIIKLPMPLSDFIELSQDDWKGPFDAVDRPLPWRLHDRVRAKLREAALDTERLTVTYDGLSSMVAVTVN